MIAPARSRIALLTLLVLLLAALTRFHLLENQSLWNDEGNSLRLAQRSIPDLIDAAGRDIHPPGYYLALKAWIGLAGDSEFGLRALSALEGLLTVTFCIALGNRLFSRSVGIIGGLIVALSPFAVYYSQEARMYAQVGLLAAASMGCFVMWMRRVSPTYLTPWPPLQNARGSKPVGSSPLSARERGFRGEVNHLRVFFALIICNAAGLYTHYSYSFTMLAQGLIFIVWIVSRRMDHRRAIIEYTGLNLLTLLIFLPWLPTAWDQINQWPGAGVDLVLDERLRIALTWITYGNTAGDIPWLRLIWPGLLIVAARPSSRSMIPLIWGFIVIASLQLSGAYRAANLKFLLPAMIAAALLMGAGAWTLWTKTPTTRRKLTYVRRLLAGVSLFLVIIGQLNGLNALYTDPAYARDNYRAIAAHITAQIRPGDAIILDAPNQAEVFTYYYQGDTPIYDLPRGLGGDDARTRADVEAVIHDHQRIFVVFWGEEERDPNHIVEAALDERAYPVMSAWYGDVRLAHYTVLDEPPTAPDITSGAMFGPTISLQGYALSAEGLSPGDVLGVTLFWQTSAPLDIRYKVAVQLLSPDGSLITQHDAEPGNNRALTPLWSPGETVIDPHGLVIPPDLAPGTYTLIVVMYDIDAPTERLPVTLNGIDQGDHLPLLPLDIQL